jgi:hypothetical protein
VFVYYPTEGVDYEEVEDDDHELVGDKAVDAAIEANRGKWKVGERFTGEEMERFREEQRGRRSHGVIRR